MKFSFKSGTRDRYGLKSVRFLSEFLPFAGEIDDGICVTKNALLLRTFVVDPHDLARALDTPIFNVLSNLKNSFRQIAGDGWYVYHDAHRYALPAYPHFYREGAPAIVKRFEASRASLSPFYQTAVYLTLCHSIAEKHSFIRQLLFRNSAKNNNILYDLEEFKTVTDDFYRMLSSTFKQVVSCNSDQQLTYFHSCISDTRHSVLTPETPFYLDHYLADGRFTPDTVCKYNDTYIVVATIHDFPAATHAGMGSKLLSIPVEFRFCTRFTFVGEEAAKKEIKSIRKTHFQKRRGIGAILQDSVLKQPTELEDTDATSLAADAGAALSRLSEGDVFYGRLATTIIVQDRNYDNAIRKIDFVKKTVNDLGFICKVETINTPAAFLGSIPGNVDFNPHQPLVSTANFAHLFCLSVPWNGNHTNEHLRSLLNSGGIAPHIITKAAGAPFFLNLNYGDVGHTLVIGPTGFGKSTLLSSLGIFWLKYPTARVIMFDKDASSYNATLACGGTFVEINDDSDSLKLNPFSDLSSKAERVFVAQLIVNHFLHRELPVAPDDEKKISDALESMSAISPDLRDWEAFSRQVQDGDIRQGIEPFVSGDYAHLFKRGPDSLQRSPWLTFELGELMKKGKPIVSFVLEYLFHRIMVLLDGTPTLLMVDEAWVFLDNPVFAAQIRDFLKTARKRNTYVLLSSQELEDARSSPIFSTIASCCMTKILLPNHRARQSENRALYTELGLSDSDLQTLSEAVPKREYFFFSPEGNQKFSLELGPEELALIKPRPPKKEALTPQELAIIHSRAQHAEVSS
jgi:type IV secretion system protein TrbE